MTPEQADKLMLAIIDSRTATRALMLAEGKDFKSACDADDAAFAEVRRQILDLTK